MTGLLYRVGGIDDGKVMCSLRAKANYRSIHLHSPVSSSFAAHRIAWKLMTGSDPAGVIDHINGVRDDNRACNLRDVTHVENARNNHGPFWRNEVKRRAEIKTAAAGTRRQQRGEHRASFYAAVLSLPA